MTVGYTLLLYDYFLTIEDEVSVALSLRVVTYYLFPLIGRIYLEIALDSREDYLFVEALWDTLWSNCLWNPSKWFIPRGLARSRSLCIGMRCLPTSFVAGLRGLWDIRCYAPSTFSGIRTQQVHCIAIYTCFDAQ